MSTAPPRRRYAPRLPAAQRRRQLLDGALALIAQKGYGSLSMEAVARACGVTKPVVYDLFANREVLVRALLEREERRALDQLTGALPTMPLPSHPDAVLVEGVQTFLRAVSSSPDTWKLMLMPVDGAPATLRDHVERGRAGVVRRLQTAVRAGLEQRGGPLSLDVELAAHVSVALAEHAARLTLTDPERFGPDRVGAFASTLMGALGTGAEREDAAGAERDGTA